MTSEPAVPIIKISGSMDVTGAGFELRFVCVLSPLGYVASVHAFSELLPVGSLKWLLDDGSGECAMVYVRPEWRRRGVGLALWEVARGVAIDNGWDEPQHSASRTAEGDALAKAVGGHLPPLSDDGLRQFGEYTYASPPPR